MSIIIVQVGQCGNQVGYALFENVYQDCFNEVSKQDIYETESIERFFYEKSIKNGNCFESRGIQIDMEEKVINHNKGSPLKWKYSSKSIYSQKQGSGNNWASGYNKWNVKISQSIDELLRHQMERSDAVDGIIVTMSVAGGTGSGVGSRICKFLRQNYSETSILGHCIWPYSQGDVAVQSYNTILSMASLLGHYPGDGNIKSNLGGSPSGGDRDICVSTEDTAVHAVLIHENDLLHQICANRLHLTNIGMQQINHLIALQLVSMLQPVQETRLPLSQLLLDNVSHPDYRFLRVRSVPYFNETTRAFSTDNWQQLSRQINQMMLTSSLLEDGLDWSITRPVQRCLSATMVARGSSSQSHPYNMTTTSFCTPSNLHLWTHPRPYCHYPNHLSCLSNSSDSVIPCLSMVNARAWSLFSSAAYIHQYQHYGIEQSYFLNCFAQLQQVIYNYQNIP